MARTSHALVIGAPKDKGQLQARGASRPRRPSIAVDRMWSKTDLRTAVVYVPRDKASLDAYFPKVGKKDSVFDGVEFPVYDRVTGGSTPTSGEPREAGNRVVINTRYVKPGSRTFPSCCGTRSRTWPPHGGPRTARRPGWSRVRRSTPPTGSTRTAAASRRPSSPPRRAGSCSRSCPSNREFYGLRTGYDRAYLLCYYIKLTYGEGKLVALYKKTGAIDEGRPSRPTR